MVIGIIGAGASGMAAALAAAENPEAQVLLFERQARVGRKLQATGNGRCNLTNTNPGIYHGEDPAFAVPALTAFDAERTLAWFRALGLFTVAEESGRVYPYSDQANSVVDVLRFGLNKPNIELFTGFEVQKLRKQKQGFSIEGTDRQFTCDKVIVACGGLAGTKLGGTMAGYRLLKKLGHSMTPLRPALVQLKCGWSGVTALKGVRASCHARILRNGDVFAESRGELQFTEFGLSGPVIFEISRDVCCGAGQWRCLLDFLPQFTKEQVTEELIRRRSTNLPIEELLTGVLHNRLGRVLTKAAGIADIRQAAELTDDQIGALCEAVKAFEVELTGPLGMDSAQVTAGGALTAQFDQDTMESRLIPGLYACGEVLDIDGDCGGYNLQWAWSSGHMAGLHAGKERQ